MIGDRLLENALGEFGVRGSSSLFRIDLEDGGVGFNFTGWSYVCSERNLELSLIRDIQ
jgi:hypothetical protein